MIDKMQNRLYILIFSLLLTCNFCWAIEDSKAPLKSHVGVNAAAPDKKYVNKIDFDTVWEHSKDHSYDLKIADYNVLIAKQGIRNARSEYFPKLYATAGTEYTRNYRDVKETTVMTVGDSFINPYTRYQAVLGITLSYNLFDFGVRKGNLDIAKEDVSLKELEEQKKMQELNLTIIDTYSKILMFKKQIELNSQILEIAKKNLELKKRLFEAKEISNSERKIFELTALLAESLNWLSFYTGEDYNIDDLKVSELKKPNFDVTEYSDYTQSVEWKIHEKELKKKELELKVAKRNYCPKVNAYSRYYLYGSNYSSYNDSLGNIQPSNFTVGGSITMPLFDGFKNSSNVQRLILELKQLQVERDKAMAEFMTKLATMRTNLIYLDKQISNDENAIKQLTDKDK
jgi:outer membrane protein TolC